MIENWPVLLAFIGVSILTATSGAVFMPGEWYKNIAKPWWTPPNWLFGPAWTLLFALIAFAGYVFYMSATPEERFWPLVIFGIQMVFNAAWSFLFFGRKRIDLAFIDAVLMALAIVATMAAFFPVSPQSAALLIPYLIWVCFAATLNFVILRLNASRRTVAGT